MRELRGMNVEKDRGDKPRWVRIDGALAVELLNLKVDGALDAPSVYGSNDVWYADAEELRLWKAAKALR